MKNKRKISWWSSENNRTHKKNKKILHFWTYVISCAIFRWRMFAGGVLEKKFFQIYKQKQKYLNKTKGKQWDKVFRPQIINKRQKLDQTWHRAFVSCTLSIKRVNLFRSAFWPNFQLFVFIFLLFSRDYQLIFPLFFVFLQFLGAKSSVFMKFRQ